MGGQDARRYCFRGTAANRLNRGGGREEACRQSNFGESFFHSTEQGTVTKEESRDGDKIVNGWWAVVVLSRRVTTAIVPRDIQALKQSDGRCQSITR